MERQGGKGYYWLGDRPELTRSLILGEEIVATWDAKVPVQKPCAWLLCLALQSAKNHHAPLPGDHPVFDEERSAESWGHGQFYLERFEPTVRRHVVPGQKGAPDTLVIGLVVRAEKESELDELADREGSEFCFPLSATSDDPQSWAQLEFFAEMFSCFYAIQVEPYLGSPFILHAPITHSFHELDDLARVRSAQDLPPGDGDEDRPRPQPEEVAANRMAFIERVCHEWGLRGADEIDRLVETARDEVRTEREREERDAEEIQRLVAAELAGEAAEPVDAEWSSTAPLASEIPRLLGPSDASQQSEAPHPSAPPQSAVQRDPRDRDFAAYQAAGLVGAPEDLKAPVPPAVADKVKKAILDVLQQEGPVEELRLGKLVANAFGIKRVRASRIEVVLEHVPGEQRRSSEFGAFIWPPSLRPDTWSYFQRQQSGEEGTRAIKEISPEEVRNALLYLVETEGGISRPDAIADLAAIFGVKRVSKGVRERLDSLISHSLASGDCTEEGGRLIAAN